MEEPLTARPTREKSGQTETPGERTSWQHPEWQKNSLLPHFIPENFWVTRDSANFIRRKNYLRMGRNHNGTVQQSGLHKNVKLLDSEPTVNKINHMKDKGLMLLISKQLLQINMKTSNQHKGKWKRRNPRRRGRSGR